MIEKINFDSLKSESNRELISGILFTVTISAVFIGIYFFTVGAKLEQTIVDEQLKLTLDTLTNNFKMAVPNYKFQLDSNDIQDDTLDAEAAATNTNLIHNATKVLTIVFIVGMILSVWIYKPSPPPYKEFVAYSRLDSIRIFIVEYFKNIVIPKLFILLFVFGTYTAFSFLVIRNFRPIDPNNVMRYILEATKSNNQN
jgi:hypothetical protein